MFSSFSYHEREDGVDDGDGRRRDGYDFERGHSIKGGFLKIPIPEPV